MPTGAQALVIHLDPRPMCAFEDPEAEAPYTVSDAIVCGPRSSPLIIGAVLGSTVGVHFKVGGARRFFGVAAHELTERVVALEDLWGPAARRLRERLYEASPAARPLMLEEFLLTRAARFDLAPSVLDSLAAFDEPRIRSVAEVNRRTGLSAKRLVGLFRDEIGLGPKEYWRVRRFRAALAQLELGARTGAAIAIDHGYSDQAHFIRECRALTGLCPSDYLAGRIAGTDHVEVRRKDPIREPAGALSFRA